MYLPRSNNDNTANGNDEERDAANSGAHRCTSRRSTHSSQVRHTKSTVQLHTSADAAVRHPGVTWRFQEPRRGPRSARRQQLVSVVHTSNNTSTGGSSGRHSRVIVSMATESTPASCALTDTSPPPSSPSLKDSTSDDSTITFPLGGTGSEKEAEKDIAHDDAWRGQRLL